MAQNQSGTLLASAARTALVSSSAVNVRSARGVRIFINATASAATPSVVPTVETQDPVSGVWTALLTGAAITGAGHTILEVYPGSTAAANTVASRPIGKTFRLTMTAGDADSLTYSAGYMLLE